MFMQPCDWRHLTRSAPETTCAGLCPRPPPGPPGPEILPDSSSPAESPDHTCTDMLFESRLHARTPPPDAARARSDPIRSGGRSAIRERRESRPSATTVRPGVQLRRVGWPLRPRPGDVGPHPEPGDSAGVHRRLDL